MADKQITPFQLTDQFTMDNFNQRINETNIALQSKPNPNLLDNWYLPNLVNQRGITSWTSDYGPDRWTAYTAINAEISSAGLTLHMTGDMTGVIAQILEEFLFNELVGKVCTFSVLFADGTMRSGSAQVSPSETTLFISDYPAFGQVYLQKSRALQIYFTQERTIKAVKLELGNQQTLAHQDADGNWVLNEIPDYGEQLARCQRYRVEYGRYAQWGVVDIQPDYIDFSIYLPVTMRAFPSIEGASNLSVNGYSGFAFQVAAFNGNNLRIRATKSNHGFTRAYLEASNKFAFVAEL